MMVILSTSCEDYLDINDNPNGAINPPLRGLLANATYNTAINVFNVGGTTSFYTQYLASPNEASPTDVYDRVNTSGTWGALYGVMGDVFDLRKFAEESGSIHITGAANILMATNLGMTVDAYGDVPFSEALDFQTITPAYDNQEALYNEVIRLLDAGIADLSQEVAGEPITGASDFIHSGNVENWIKTGYALKARYLNHLTGTSSYDPSAVLAAVDQAYTSSDDDADVTEFQLRNPWAQVAVNNAGLVLGGWLSEQFVDAMNGETYGVFDPRLPLITDATASGTYVGTANGVGRTGDGTGPSLESVLTTDGYYSSTNSPLTLISYAEVKLIEAEAAWRAGNTQRAYDAYIEGITANHIKLGVDLEDAIAYLADPSVSVGADNLTPAEVFRQKYVITFLHPEAWVDARRYNYGYKDFSIPANDMLGGQFIRRFDYPDTEYQRNAANVPVLELTQKMFWDN